MGRYIWIFIECCDLSSMQSEEYVLYPAVSLHHRDDSIKLLDTAGIVRCHDPMNTLPDKQHKYHREHARSPYTSKRMDHRDPCCTTQPFPTLRILRQSSSMESKEATWLTIQ